MSDEKIDTGGGQGDQASPSTSSAEQANEAERNTDVFAPKVDGGQPAVGGDLPRNTEL